MSGIDARDLPSGCEPQYVPLQGGGRVALYRLARQSSDYLPLLLVHGSVSNADSMRDLGDYLHARGFDCWLLDWGGHGESVAGRARQDFEQAAFSDVPAAIDHVLAATGQPRCHWLAHSGGGHLLLMYLARHPAAQRKLAGCVIIGAQATDYASSPRRRLAAATLWLVTMLCGRTPARMIGMASEPEPSLLLAQWASWNLRGRWLGRDGFDYLEALGELALPVLVVAGGGDRIAPLSGCRAVYEAIGSAQKVWLGCTLEAGFSQNLSHGQLIRGRAARRELYPRYHRWLCAVQTGKIDRAP